MKNSNTEVHELVGDDGEQVLVIIKNDANRWHWEIHNEVWQEVQPSDPDRETCIRDFHENMKVYSQLGIYHSGTLLELAKELLQEISK